MLSGKIEGQKGIPPAEDSPTTYGKAFIYFIIVSRDHKLWDNN